MYLHHVPKCEYVVNQQHDENYNHDILKITIESNELTKKLMNKKLQIIKIYQVDALK
jgi:hypothetical protein